MYHPQESSSSFTQSTCLPLQPSASASISNPDNVTSDHASLYPHPFLPSDPSLAILGFDVFSNGFAFHQFNLQQPVYYNDPNSVSSSWVSKQVGPLRYPNPIVKSMKETPTPASSVGYVPSLNTNYQQQINILQKKILKATKLSHAVRCEVCNIDCNSVDVYEKHISGKKHLKQLQIKHAPSPASTLPCTSATEEDLGTKKQRLIENGVGEGLVRICTACNVVCNSEIAFADHLSGKKHIEMVQKVNDGNTTLADPNKAIASPSRLNLKATPDDLESKKKKILEGGTPANAVKMCTLCNIVCNSNVVYNLHLSGKKHITMVNKLAQTNKTAASTTPS